MFFANLSLAHEEDSHKDKLESNWINIWGTQSAVCCYFSLWLFQSDSRLICVLFVFLCWRVCVVRQLSAGLKFPGAVCGAEPFLHQSSSGNFVLLEDLFHFYSLQLKPWIHLTNGPILWEIKKTALQYGIIISDTFMLRKNWKCLIWRLGLWWQTEFILCFMQNQWNSRKLKRNKCHCLEFFFFFFFWSELNEAPKKELKMFYP